MIMSRSVRLHEAAGLVLLKEKAVCTGLQLIKAHLQQRYTSMKLANIQLPNSVHTLREYSMAPHTNK